MNRSDYRSTTPDPIEEIGLDDHAWRDRFGVPFGRIEEAVEQMARAVTAHHGRAVPLRTAA